MKLLADVLDEKFAQFNTVSASQPLRDALQHMSCENLDYLLVQEGARFIGILSEQDVAHKLFSRSKPLDELQVKDLMNSAIPVGDISDSVAVAIQVMKRHNSRYIAVFDGLEFIGIVSENDLLMHSMANMIMRPEMNASQDAYHWSY